MQSQAQGRDRDSVSESGAERASIEVHSAWQKPELARLFLQGQQRALAAFGVPSCVASKAPGRGVELIMARDEQGELIGGMRLHLAGELGALPMEDVVGPVLPSGERWAGAELGGVWVAPERRKDGLSSRLMRATIAAARRLRLRHVVLFGHQHVAPFYKRHGFVTDTRFPARVYPDERYLSFVMRLDPIWLELASQVPLLQAPAVWEEARAAAA